MHLQSNRFDNAFVMTAALLSLVTRRGNLPRIAGQLTALRAPIPAQPLSLQKHWRMNRLFTVDSDLNVHLWGQKNVRARLIRSFSSTLSHLTDSNGQGLPITGNMEPK
ncbi:hypothetical protein Y032_0148g2630 [Ancylostoma ceylanicum]|uniref:Uncharacterized protein n=1 Tax=Ancylostoma ceylanicum TaxID=53326 RepID=A0A016T1L8_9BILA|nr:hypothetical protein Y032_0148g2630 [Ancylostoma ceylanicum]